MNRKNITHNLTVLIFVLFFTILNTISYANEEVKNNLILNGDFKELEQNKKYWTGKSPKNWPAWVPGNYLENKEIKENIKKNYKYEILEDFEGRKNVLHIYSKDEFRTCIKQEIINIDSKKDYKLNFDIKTDNKVGLFRVRIREFIQGKENKDYWYSETYHGSKDWIKSENIYRPSANVSKIALELFYEKGTGGVYVDNVQLLPVERIQDDEFNKIEDNITLELHQKYFLNKQDLNYKINNSEIANIENGFIIPKSVGDTTISVLDNGEEKTINLKIINTNEKYLDMIEEWNRAIAGNEFYDPNNSIMVENHKKLESEAQNYVDTFNNKMENYLWEDAKNYKESKFLTKTYRKLELLAKQITNKSSKFYDNKNAIAIVKNSLNWMYHNVYNEKKNIVGNWWDYEIGTPRAINNTLSLMHKYFSKEDIDKYIKPIYKFVPDSSKFRATLEPFKAKGGNLVDMGRVKVIAGILKKDSKTIAETIKSMQQLFDFVTKDEGFYLDGSYIAHGSLASTGSYGNVLIDGLTQLLPVIQKTEAPIESDKLNILLKWYENSFIPLIYKGELMDMSRGRGISRPNLQAHAAAVEVLRSIARTSDLFDLQTNQRLKSIIKTTVENDKFYNVYDGLISYNDIALFNKILNDKNVKLIDRKSYIKNFANMDKAVIFNSDRGYAIGLSMHSSRTQNYEEMNNENKRGWYTGDGMIYLYNGDLSHYSNGYWPTVDATKLPSVTSLEEVRESGKNSGSQRKMESSLVGGLVKDNKHAIFGMDFSNWNKTLYQKKSWFVLGDKIVFLGSPIDNKTDKNVYTTIENRKLDSSGYDLFVDGNKLELNNSNKEIGNVKNILLLNKDKNKNIGYKLLQENLIDFKKETRQDSWFSINEKDGTKDLVTNTFISAVSKYNNKINSYAYIMYPNISKTEFDKEVGLNDIKVLENTKDLQIIEDIKNKTIMGTKYDSKEYQLYEEVKISDKGFYYLTKINNSFELEYKGFDDNKSIDKIVIDLDKYEIKNKSIKDGKIEFSLKSKGNNNIGNNDNNIGNDNNSGKVDDGIVNDNNNIEHIKLFIKKTNKALSEIHPDLYKKLLNKYNKFSYKTYEITPMINNKKLEKTENLQKIVISLEELGISKDEVNTISIINNHKGKLININKYEITDKNLIFYSSEFSDFVIAYGDIKNNNVNNPNNNPNTGDFGINDMSIIFLLSMGLIYIIGNKKIN